jgi:hypothetical protein
LPPYLFQRDLLPVLDGVEDDPAARYTLYTVIFVLGAGSERVRSLELLEGRDSGGGRHSGAEGDIG